MSPKRAKPRAADQRDALDFTTSILQTKQQDQRQLQPGKAMLCSDSLWYPVEAMVMIAVSRFWWIVVSSTHMCADATHLWRRLSGVIAGGDFVRAVMLVTTSVRLSVENIWPSGCVCRKISVGVLQNSGKMGNPYWNFCTYAVFSRLSVVRWSISSSVCCGYWFCTYVERFQ